MAFEPVSIFSRRVDPLGVVNLLKRIAADVDITGPLSCWEQIVVSGRKRGRFNKVRKLTFSHDAEYYESNGWHQQVFGCKITFPASQTCDSSLKSCG